LAVIREQNMNNHFAILLQLMTIYCFIKFQQTKDMSTTLIKEFNYNVPIEKVWQALINKDEMVFPSTSKV